MAEEPKREVPDATGILRRMREERENQQGISLEAARASVGPGWRDLAEDAWRAVTDAGGCVLQVKEKYGDLRVYYEGVLPARAAVVSAQIERLKGAANRTCEWCGAPGELREIEYEEALGDLRDGRHWWYKTLCAEHAWRFYVDNDHWWSAPAWKEDRDG